MAEELLDGAEVGAFGQVPLRGGRMWADQTVSRLTPLLLRAAAEGFQNLLRCSAGLNNSLKPPVHIALVACPARSHSTN